MQKQTEQIQGSCRNQAADIRQLVGMIGMIRDGIITSCIAGMFTSGRTGVIRHAGSTRENMRWMHGKKKQTSRLDH
jgi:hypothetical protein